MMNNHIPFSILVESLEYIQSQKNQEQSLRFYHRFTLSYRFSLHIEQWQREKSLLFQFHPSHDSDCSSSLPRIETLWKRSGYRGFELSFQEKIIQLLQDCSRLSRELVCRRQHICVVCFRGSFIQCQCYYCLYKTFNNSCKANVWTAFEFVTTHSHVIQLYPQLFLNCFSQFILYDRKHCQQGRTTAPIVKKKKMPPREFPFSSCPACSSSSPLFYCDCHFAQVYESFCCESLLQLEIQSWLSCFFCHLAASDYPEIYHEFAKLYRHCQCLLIIHETSDEKVCHWSRSQKSAATEISRGGCCNSCQSSQKSQADKKDDDDVNSDDFDEEKESSLARMLFDFGYSSPIQHLENPLYNSNNNPNIIQMHSSIIYQETSIQGMIVLNGKRHFHYCNNRLENFSDSKYFHTNQCPHHSELFVQYTILNCNQGRCLQWLWQLATLCVPMTKTPLMILAAIDCYGKLDNCSTAMEWLNRCLDCFYAEKDSKSLIFIIVVVNPLK